MQVNYIQHAPLFCICITHAQIGFCYFSSRHVPNFTGNVKMLSVELDRPVVLAKATEHTTQVAISVAFPSPVPKLTGNVEVLGVELDRLVVLAKAIERITQVAISVAFPSPHLKSC